MLPKTDISIQYSRDLPGDLGCWRKWPFIFRELVRTGKYLKGARERAKKGLAF